MGADKIIEYPPSDDDSLQDSGYRNLPFQAVRIGLSRNHDASVPELLLV